MVLGGICPPGKTGQPTMHRILIVSEDIFLRDLIRLSLADMRAEIRCATDGEQMRSLCRRMLFDVVIVLCTAPFLCGPDVVRGIRPSGLRRPLFYVVAWQQAEQAVLSLLESGVDQYLTFPVNLHRLRSKVACELEYAL